MNVLHWSRIEILKVYVPCTLIVVLSWVSFGLFVNFLISNFLSFNAHVRLVFGWIGKLPVTELASVGVTIEIDDCELWAAWWSWCGIKWKQEGGFCWHLFDIEKPAVGQNGFWTNLQESPLSLLSLPSHCRVAPSFPRCSRATLFSIAILPDKKILLQYLSKSCKSCASISGWLVYVLYSKHIEVWSYVLTFWSTSNSIHCLSGFDPTSDPKSEPKSDLRSDATFNLTSDLSKLDILLLPSWIFLHNCKYMYY